MGFWTWLTGKKPRVTTTDRIWLTRPARCRGLCRELLEHLSNAQPVLLLAHFPATLTEMQRELSGHGVPYNLASQPISTKEVNRLANQGAERLVHLFLVKQLQSDPFPARAAEEEGLVGILVAERHFLRSCDEAVVSFAETLEKRCHVTYHCSLDDPLMKVFAGEWVKGFLQRLGMDESSPIESAMVARRVRDAQKKFAAGAEDRCDADSAENWLRSNGFGEYLQDA